MNEFTPDILLDDRPVLAVNKPAGLLTEGPPQVPSLVAGVKDCLKREHDKPGRVYLGVPHRLDRPVSGVIIFSRNSKGAARLSEEFEHRRVRKIYWAVIVGQLDTQEGEWIDWLRKRDSEAHVEITEPGEPRAKEARMTYRVLRSEGELTLLEVELITGRMHQIRVQCAARGCPVLGDVQYGAPEPWHSGTSTANDSDPKFSPIALHARSLTFRHPVRFDDVTIDAPVPDVWPLTGG